ARLDQWPHLTEEEREQQRADVAAVDVGVGKDDHLVIAGLEHIELEAETATDGGDQRLDLGIAQHLVYPCSLDVEDLAPDGKDRLHARVTSAHSRATGRIAFDDEDLTLVGIAAVAVFELVGHARAIER